MIKAIRDLENLDPELKERVLQKFEALPYKRELIRYSYGELQQFSKHQHSFWQKWGHEGIFRFREKFTDAEIAVIDSFSRSNRKDYIERQKQKVKVSTDRVSRIIRDLVKICEKEIQLQEQIDQLSTQRIEMVKGKVAE